LSQNDGNPKDSKIELKKEKKIQIVSESRPTEFFYGQESNKDKDVNEFEMFD
jgi:hypothetical protein